MYERLKRTSESASDAVERLTEIMQVLRGPDGCPWDREQTHESLIRGMIEEAYEVVEAIENGHADNLKEELGDVLLQIVMHADIASENGLFSLKEIADAASEKMLRRHPHVFGKKSAQTLKASGISVDNVHELWENVKQGERGETSYTEEMKRIPRHLPALPRSEKIQVKARGAGFDWDDVSGAFQKIGEEIEELEEARLEQNAEHIRHEVGDVLFAAVNIARFLNVDPEEALNAASERFIRRFSSVEDEANLASRALESMSLDELNQLWELAKEKEREECRKADAGGKK